MEGRPVCKLLEPALNPELLIKEFMLPLIRGTKELCKLDKALDTLFSNGLNISSIQDPDLRSRVITMIAGGINSKNPFAKFMYEVFGITINGYNYQQGVNYLRSYGIGNAVVKRDRRNIVSALCSCIKYLDYDCKHVEQIIGNKGVCIEVSEQLRDVEEVSSPNEASKVIKQYIPKPGGSLKEFYEMLTNVREILVETTRKFGALIFILDFIPLKIMVEFIRLCDPQAKDEESTIRRLKEIIKLFKLSLCYLKDIGDYSLRESNDTLIFERYGRVDKITLDDVLKEINCFSIKGSSILGSIRAILNKAEEFERKIWGESLVYILQKKFIKENIPTVLNELPQHIKDKLRDILSNLPLFFTTTYEKPYITKEELEKIYLSYYLTSLGLLKISCTEYSSKPGNIEIKARYLNDSELRELVMDSLR